MLHFILSGVGGGKTTNIINLMKDYLKCGLNMTLIVPEQFSLMNEKLLLNELGTESLQYIDILTFTSLAEKIVDKYSSSDRRRLSDSSAAVFMHKALYKVADQLRIYGKHIGKKSTVEEFLKLSSEFKQSSLTTDSVRIALDEMPESILKLKLNDIITILDEYDSIVSSSYFNSNDLLSDLSVRLPYDDYFDNRIVFIDSFRGFSSQEYGILESILKKSKTVYVSLCTYDLNNYDDYTDLFACTKMTAKRLSDICKKNGIGITEKNYLSKGGKFKNFPPHFQQYLSPELCSLEKIMFSPVADKYEEECNDIFLCKARDIYSECDFVACSIKKLIRKYEYRYRDIAVIARNIDEYDSPLRSALKKYDIDVFQDTRRNINSSPVMNLISGVVSVVTKGFETEHIMRCLKTSLCGLSTEDISDLENYAYIWQIKRSEWTEDFIKNPSGPGVMSDSDIKELSRINEIRKKAITPLLVLKSKLKGSNGYDIADAFYQYLVDINASENLKILSADINRVDDEGLVLELERMWNLLMEILDEFSILTHDDTLTLKEINDIFELMLSVKTVGVIPQGLDEIIIGSADRTRTFAPKVLFVVGVNNGVFPAFNSNKSALTDKDRDLMEKYGIKLSDSREYKMAEEKLIAYNTFCCAKEKLYVSCSMRNSKGEDLSESEYYYRIKELFPKVREYDADDIDPFYYIEGKVSTFEQYARSKQDIFSETLKEYFKNEPDYNGKIASVDRARVGRTFNIADTEIAKKLFGNTINMSASKIEDYYKCPFSYFCKFGLKAFPRKIVELDPFIRGNVIHYALEQLLSHHSKDELINIDDDSLMSIILEIMNEYLKTELEGIDTTKRFLKIYEKMSKSVFDIAKRLICEFNRSDFSPVYCEMPVGKPDGIPAYNVSDENKSVVLSGYIDRVDEAIIDGKKYIRIVDYKSGGKKFTLSDTIQGINLQMLIYLFAIWQNGKAKFGDVNPAGVLYFQAKSDIISSEIGDEDEDYEQRLKNARMDGIVLENFDVINAMENGCGGLFIPVSITEKGIKGNVISIENLKLLKEKTDNIILEMAQLLHQGEIPALPIESSKHKNICQYCDYRSVCMYEDSIPVRTLFEVDNDTVMEILNNKEVDSNALDT